MSLVLEKEKDLFIDLSAPGYGVDRTVYLVVHLALYFFVFFTLWLIYKSNLYLIWVVDLLLYVVSMIALSTCRALNMGYSKKVAFLLGSFPFLAMAALLFIVRIEVIFLILGFLTLASIDRLCIYPANYAQTSKEDIGMKIAKWGLRVVGFPALIFWLFRYP